MKLVLHAMHENELPFINGGEHIAWAPDIPIWLSLVVIVGTLLVTTVASLAKTGRDAKAGLRDRFPRLRTQTASQTGQATCVKRQFLYDVVLTGLGESGRHLPCC